MLLKKKLSLILLVDDDHDDNVFHQIILREMDIVDNIHVVGNGVEALAYLGKEKNTPPELIFLDINMPRMNGWEFLEQYKHLDVKQKARIVIMMLSTSTNPDDMKRAEHIKELTGFQTKPLNRETMTEILNEHFKDYF